MLQKCTTSDSKSVPLVTLDTLVHGFVNVYPVRSSGYLHSGAIRDILASIELLVA
jgi:hypothetical protein